MHHSIDLQYQEIEEVMLAFFVFFHAVCFFLVALMLILVIATSIRRGSASRKGPLRMLASHALHRDHMPGGGGIAYAWGQCVCVRAVHMMLSISISFSISLSIRSSINIIISEGFSICSSMQFSTIQCTLLPFSITYT